MKKFLKIISITLSVALLFSVMPKPTLSASNLVKSFTSSAVYYIDSSGARHAFPTLEIYQSWYGNNFSNISEISQEDLAKYPLAKNIVFRSGKNLVKVPSASQIYAVEPGGLLRHIENEEIAQNLYGNNWDKLVKELPEVFWQNYTIGESLKHLWQIPEGVVYQIKNEETIYWKEGMVIRPFESKQALIANGYNQDDIILGEGSFYTRAKPITIMEKSIFDPVELPYIDARDCENKNLKVAFLFITKGDYSIIQIDKILTLQENLGPRFSWATDNLSAVDASNTLFSLIDDGYLTRDENGLDRLNKDEIAQSFYAQNPDVFDFLIMFTDFKVFERELADFLVVSNKVSGLGKPLMDSASFYGSIGKLKGIINMGNIERFDISTTHGLNQIENYILHEILHNWSGAVTFVNEAGQKDKSLLRKPDYGHWNNNVGFVSPLGGFGWQDNNNGTFTSLTSQLVDSADKKYTDLDLYLMGLIPSREIEPVMYIVPKDKDDANNTIEAESKFVDIEQILEAHGQVRCTQ